MNIKKELQDIKETAKAVTRSDLQGIVMGKALKLNKNKVVEIENIFLLFCDDELDLNTAKRYLLEIIGGK